MASPTPSAPVTRSQLRDDLGRLGLQAGQSVLVHTSLKALGWVVGGPVSVVLALEDVLTPTGTLVMPTFTPQHSDPSLWTSPPIPESWWPAVVSEMPAYRPDLTPTWGMGAVPECFRTQDAVQRSTHPRVSFAAWGRHAAGVTADHALAYELGDTSPLAALYDLDASVLFLGTGYLTCTALHLAEYRAAAPPLRERSVPVLDGHGQRVWATYPDVKTDDTAFPALGVAYEAAGGSARRGRVGSATAALLPMVPLVDFGVGWVDRQRARTHSDQTVSPLSP